MMVVWRRGSRVVQLAGHGAERNVRCEGGVYSWPSGWMVDCGRELVLGRKIMCLAVVLVW